MNIGNLVSSIKDKETTIQIKTNVSNLETSQGMFYNTHNLYSKDTAAYYINLIYLFDRAILSNNLHVLSIEQERLLAKFFKQANTLTRQHTSAENQDYLSNEDAFLQNIWLIGEYLYSLDLNHKNEYNNAKYNALFEAMGRDIQNLDDFLGSYFGEDDGRYAKYGS